LRRLELRQRKGEDIVVTAYEQGKTIPSLAFYAGDGRPRLVTHVENILVFQRGGGASDHVYDFAFRAGKPSVALRAAMKEFIQVRQRVCSYRERAAHSVSRTGWQIPIDH
jgi:hypothetical protein